MDEMGCGCHYDEAMPLREWTFTLGLEPVAKGRPRLARSGHAFTPAKTRTAEARVRELLRREVAKDPLWVPLTTAISVHCVFFLKRPKTVKRLRPTGRPDGDNFLKLILDAGNEILWADDSQIVFGSYEKRYASSEAQVGYVLFVNELESEESPDPSGPKKKAKS